MVFFESTNNIRSHHPGNNLIVRPSSLADAEEILQLVDTVFGDMMEEAGNTHMSYLAQRIMSGTHPTAGPEDFTVVEDIRRTERRIVGCTGMLRHTWMYENIPFKVGRPEIIATYPEYRHQGLIRALFALVHSRSKAQGHHIQAITGIPYFYRQFGYEYALELWNTITINSKHIPEITDGTFDMYPLRDATVEDIPLIQKLYADHCRKGMISLSVDERWWHHQIQTWSMDPARNINSHVQTIECKGEAKGYILTSAPQTKHFMQLWDLQCTDDVNLETAIPIILRKLFINGTQERSYLQQDGSLTELRCMLGQTHSVFPLLNILNPNTYRDQYAWYIRVSELPAFLMHIAPVLEARLANAYSGAFAGELKLDFYRDGLRLVFKDGRLTTAELWKQDPGKYVKADAGFPPEVFLQLLFGRRSLAELCYILPDVWIKNERFASLLSILFPTRTSWVLPLW